MCRQMLENIVKKMPRTKNSFDNNNNTTNNNNNNNTDSNTDNNADNNTETISNSSGTKSYTDIQPYSEIQRFVGWAIYSRRIVVEKNLEKRKTKIWSSSLAENA